MSHVENIAQMPQSIVTMRALENASGSYGLSGCYDLARRKLIAFRMRSINTAWPLRLLRRECF